MDWLTALGPSLLVVIGGIISWLLKARTEELRATEEKLRSERRKIYSEILEPYIRMFVDLKGKGPDQALKKMMSFDYRKTAFELNLFGSDEVVRAYNALMQYAYQAEASGSRNPRDFVLLWGHLLLEIRKSLGNERTKLNEADMLRGMITDIDELA